MPCSILCRFSWQRLWFYHFIISHDQIIRYGARTHIYATRFLYSELRVTRLCGSRNGKEETYYQWEGGRVAVFVTYSTLKSGLELWEPFKLMTQTQIVPLNVLWKLKSIPSVGLLRSSYKILISFTQPSMSLHGVTHSWWYCSGSWQLQISGNCSTHLS